ncbi:MAG: hydrogenase formation protein HypD [Dehalococcoidia bacterium]|nr:MAG: hydrogenase formation protein HypD [Dehalococcoidia bacterium]
MRYVREFHDAAAARGLAATIERITSRSVNLMEVCGTHTVAIFRHGIRDLLPPPLSMLSGPGCPVCVTTNGDIDKAIALAEQPGLTLATFGDMMKVPGSYQSLQQVKADGSDVRVVYSPRDAVCMARDNPQRPVVFFAVGFETTVPTIAASLLEAEALGLKNFYLISVHKLIPPAMLALLEAGDVRIDGFICPGHVSVVIGSQPYQFIPQQYGVPCVITGFEPLDVLQGIEMLLRQIAENRAEVEIQYRRGVRPEGNPLARELVSRVFETSDADWRGLGCIPASGLKLRPEYSRFDAEEAFAIKPPPTKEHKGCLCGDILRGVKTPPECPLFAGTCTPERPVGPCMVSSEGTCAGWYQYGSR